MPKNVSSPIHTLFNNRRLRRVALKLRVPMGILLFILIIRELKPGWFFPGLLVSLIGQMLQVWCMSTIKTKKELTVTGPYMFVRNPMYLGRFLMICGVLMMTGNPWLLLLLGSVYYFYMVNRVKREEKVLSELFGEAYEDYCRDVHPYLPGFKRFDQAALWAFSRESFKQNNVLTNIVVPFACYILLYYFSFLQPV